MLRQTSHWLRVNHVVMRNRTYRGLDKITHQMHSHRHASHYFLRLCYSEDLPQSRHRRHCRRDHHQTCYRRRTDHYQKHSSSSCGWVAPWFSFYLLWVDRETSRTSDVQMFNSIELALGSPPARRVSLAAMPVAVIISFVC